MATNLTAGGSPGLLGNEERLNRFQFLMMMAFICAACFLGVAGSWNRSGWVCLETVVILLGVFLVIRRSRAIWGHWTNPTSLFFAFAVSDVLFCYVTANLRAGLVLLFGVPVVIQPYFAYSFLIIATGIASAVIVYTWIDTSQNGLSRATIFLLRYLVSVNENTIARRAALVTILGIGLMAIGFAGEGSIPILSPNINMARYAFGEGGSASFSHSLVRRGLATLVISVPILIIYIRKRKAIGLWLLVFAGLITTICSVERAPIATLFARIVFLDLVAGGARIRKLFIYVALGLPLFIVSQYVLLSAYRDKMADVSPLAVASVQIGELSDLAWDLSNWDFHPLYGKTYAAAIIPLPETRSQFKYEYSLPRLTKRLIGLDDDALFGGLRPTAFGEAFFNFLFPGVIFIGASFGWFSAFMERSCRSAIQMSKGRVLPLFPFAHLWVWLLLFYQAGSTAFMDGFVELLVVAAIFAFTRVVPESQSRGRLAASSDA